jgi:threonine/homoserine/homoserine lactone efflux protein
MDQLLVPLIVFAVAMSFTPGPNVVMVTASAANHGFHRIIPHMLGITLGFALMVMIVGVGLGSLVLIDPRFHALLKWIGAAYLLYLAWRIANSGASDKEAVVAKPIGFYEAALFQWVNPKGWVFAVGALATFTTAGGNILIQTAIVTTVLASACLASVLVWAAFGVYIGRVLTTRRARLAFNWSMAALLVASLIPVFYPV